MLLITRVYCVLELWHIKTWLIGPIFSDTNQDQKEEKLSLIMLLYTRVYCVLELWYFKDTVNWSNFLKESRCKRNNHAAGEYGM